PAQADEVSRVTSHRRQASVYASGPSVSTTQVNCVQMRKTGQRRVTVLGTDRRSARHARRYAGLAGAAVIALLATACSSGSHSSVSPAQSKAQASASASAHAAALARDLRITPADGSHGASPSDLITVT